jgi:hypothetical protein
MGRPLQIKKHKDDLLGWAKREITPKKKKLNVFNHLSLPLSRGVEFELAKQLGIKVIWALSLPGKVAPVTSGEIICDTIQNILAERGGSR